MRHTRRLSLGALGAAALTLGLILSGCNATATTTTGGQGAVDVATEAPTSTPLPTATTGPIVQAFTDWPGCQLVPTPTQPAFITVGGLSVSIPQRLNDYPSELMPNNEPNAPYQIAASAVNAYAPNPPVNPHLESGYVFEICNKTSVAHSLTSMSARIASFTPRSGPVTVWHICGDGPYNPATKQMTPGCGSGFAGAILTATLPNDSAGAAAPVTGATWPATIGPNQSIAIAVAVNGLTTQGTYTLTFGVSVDGAAPATMTPSDGPFLMAPSAAVWTGTACQTPAMLAQIPATNQDTYYVCPPAS